MYREEYYDYSSKEGKIIKNDLKSLGLHHLTISSLPADFFRMSKSQLEKLFERASDAFIARMYDIPQYQVEKRRGDFGIKQLGCTLNRMEREEETAKIFKEILRIVSNEYNNGNFPHTNSTPLNCEKEFLYMKATGIVRRIDDLGRVVIPKEIRRTMRIREGEMLEIFTGRENEVVFKKYSPLGGVAEHAAMFAEAASKASGVNVAICDRDTVTAAAGKDKRAVLGKNVSRELNELMENRRAYTAEKEDTRITDTGEGSISHFCPVVADGNVVGGVMSFRTEGFSVPAEAEKQIVSTGAMFLSGQMEI